MEGVNRIEGSNIAIPDLVARIVKVCVTFPTHTSEQLKDLVSEEDAQKFREALQTIPLQQLKDQVFKEFIENFFGEEYLQNLHKKCEDFKIIPPSLKEVGGEEAFKNIFASVKDIVDKCYDSIQIMDQGLEELENIVNTELKDEMGEEAFQNMCATLNKWKESNQELSASLKVDLNLYQDCFKYLDAAFQDLPSILISLSSN